MEKFNFAYIYNNAAIVCKQHFITDLFSLFCIHMICISVALLKDYGMFRIEPRNSGIFFSQHLKQTMLFGSDLLQNRLFFLFGDMHASVRNNFCPVSLHFFFRKFQTNLFVRKSSHFLL